MPRPPVTSLLPVGLLLAAMPFLPGCRSAGGAEERPNYRTIRVDPTRDTDAARRLNQTGLEELEAGRLEEAEAAFQEALTADVEFGPAHNNLGKVYFEREDWYRAAWEFEYARKLLPRRAEPTNNLALVLERAGELDRAVEHFREAVHLEPDNVVYRANLARALVRRGDRTREVRTLLEQVIERDTRTAWIVWARRQLEQRGFTLGR